MNRSLHQRARILTKHLRYLTAVITRSIAALDQIMKGPSTEERGKAVAQICNDLEMANDQAKHFGLGESLRKRLKDKESANGGVIELSV